MAFELKKVRSLIIPKYVQVHATAGVFCIVCNHVETFKLHEYLKNSELRTRLMKDWLCFYTHLFLPGKHFCKSCAPISVQDDKCKQAYIFALEEENRRRMCLFN